MAKNPITWLYQELPVLVSKGVLEQDSADKLRCYYGEVKSKSRNKRLLIICGVAGALFIGLGIILIFAHNWEQFSRNTRVVLSFTPLVIAQGLAFWVLIKRPQSSAFKEGAATFLTLMVGASLALIGQTYNIADTGTFAITWMLLILPIVYLMQASLTCAIYLTGVTYWACSQWHSPTQMMLVWPLIALAVPHFIWSLKKEIYTIRSEMIAFFMAICILFATGFNLSNLGDPFSWPVIFSSLFTIYYSVGSQEYKNLTESWKNPFFRIGRLGLFVFIYLFTFRFFYELPKSHELGSTSIVLLKIYSAVFLILVSSSFFYKNLKEKKLIRSLFTSLPLIILLSTLFFPKNYLLSRVIFNGLLFALSASYLHIGVRKNSNSLINTGMALLALLIITRFFDSNINFIIKGLVFIVTGIGFLAVNFMLVRRKGSAQ